MAKIQGRRLVSDGRHPFGPFIRRRFFLGIAPWSLGFRPVSPVFHRSLDIKRDPGFAAHPAAHVHVLPIEAGLAGAMVAHCDGDPFAFRPSSDLQGLLPAGGVVVRLRKKSPLTAALGRDS